MPKAAKGALWVVIPLLLIALGTWVHYHSAMVTGETFRIIGNRDEPGAWYGFWSGFGGSLQVFTIPLAIGIWYWHHTCHHSWSCLRWGKYAAAGGTFMMCARHHPDMKDHTGSRHELIHKLHHEWKQRGQPA